MTSSVAPTTAASQLHITTTATATATSALTSPSSNHSPSNARSSLHSASSSPRGSSTTGGTNQACAACKYQRRKCNPDCPLAPYFPADQQRRFLNAHRLFGVSNILKTLKKLRPDLCADAMGTLIYQSDMRAQDPVGGCYRLILSLERQFEIETAELSAVLHHLALCRQAATAATAMPPQQQSGGMADLDVTSSNQPLLLNAQQEVVDALYTTTHEADMAILPTDEVVHHHGGGHSPKDDHGEQQQQLFDYFYYDATASDDASSKPTIDINLDNMQQFDFDDSCAAADKVDLTSPAGPDEEIRHQQQHLDVNCGQIDAKDYFEIKAASLVDAFDMRQELQPVVDVNDAGVDIDIKTVDVNAGIGVDIKAMHMNANVDVNVDLQEEDGAINVSTQMAAESSHCRLGLGFSSF
ncbi:uncharacterized protein [Miscanthus floridulus]|uniref:uncharacterized protein n=1 Tax=Miscanthus floridulus TaxID=154761 RepID=UPI00345973F5